MAKKKSAFVRAGSRKITSDRKRKSKEKKVPWRDIEKNGVTYTFLSNFLQCREAARLEYVEGLTQAGMIAPLEFGQLFHLGFELLAAGRPHTDIHQVTKDYVDRRIKFDKFKGRDKTEFLRLKAICDVMFPLYAAYYQSPLSATSGDPTPRGVEFHNDTVNVAQERPFVLEHTLPVSGRTVPMNGRFDGILRLGRQQRLYLMENKTKSQIDSDGLTAYLPFDLQTMIYCFALEKEYKEPVAGIIYNVVKRPGHKHNPDKESLEEHAARVGEIVAENPHEFFMRWHIDLGPDDVANYVNNTLNPILENVMVWWDSIKEDPFNPFVLRDGTRNPHHFLNPEGLYTKYGKSRYFELLTRGSMYGLKRRSLDASRKETASRTKPTSSSGRTGTGQVRKQRAASRSRTAAR